MRVEVETELARDLAMLDAVEAGGRPAFRTWATELATVVVGRGVRIPEEVDETFCREAGIPIVRRPSGGRSVLIGPGTLQYTFVLPISLAQDLASIPGTKRLCNRLLIAALAHAAVRTSKTIVEDASGDLVVGGRKFAGVALRRRRNAVLLHGTLLLDADVELIARALHHPVREPAYRAGRGHTDFLANFGAVDEPMFTETARTLLASIG
jgi:lipoate-protein ligase A